MEDEGPASGMANRMNGLMKGILKKEFPSKSGGPTFIHSTSGGDSMSKPYLCPSCGTNRTRFNLIEQVVHPVKKDPHTGEITETIGMDDPLQIPYTGEPLRVQCGVCGLVEPEERFVKTAQSNPFPAGINA
jgi:hypothetical protein